MLKKIEFMNENLEDILEYVNSTLLYLKDEKSMDKEEIECYLSTIPDIVNNLKNDLKEIIVINNLKRQLYDMTDFI